MIKTEHLSIDLMGNEILKDISLSIVDGEYVSIVGPNGAGKTTLIKCLAGIYQEWKGSITVRGKSLADYDSRKLARLQSYVPQAEGRTTALTVDEFVKLGRYPHLTPFNTLQAHDYAAVDQALEKTDMTGFRNRSMDSLSGGERQMVFIAAAFAQEAEILLLDEPTTFLDYSHQAEVMKMLSLCRDDGLTVVAVHHDINLAAVSSSRMIALKNGQLEFDGTPQEILNEAVLERIYDTSFEIIDREPLPLVCLKQ